MNLTKQILVILVCLLLYAPLVVAQEPQMNRDPQTDRLRAPSQGTVGAEASLSGGKLTVSSGPETSVAGALIGRSDAGPTWPTCKLRDFGTRGRIAKFGGSDTLVNSAIFEDLNRRIGIGTTTPGSALTMAGQIETKAGGIKFANGTAPPTSAAAQLFQVHHDATLTGLGTEASPLGVAIPLVLNSFVDNPDPLIQVANHGGVGIRSLGGPCFDAVRAFGGPDCGIPGVPTGDGVVGFGGNRSSGTFLTVAGDGVVGIGGNHSGIGGFGGRGVEARGGSGSELGGFGVVAVGGEGKRGGAGLNAFGGNALDGRGGDGIVARAGTSSPGFTSLAGRFDFGNIFIDNLGGGIILKSPSGAICRLLSIDDAGTLVITVITCP